MITATDRKAARDMSTEDASMIIRRKPQGPAEFKVVRTALIALMAIGMDQGSIEREAMRELSFPEELVLAEFIEGTALTMLD